MSKNKADLVLRQKSRLAKLLLSVCHSQYLAASLVYQGFNANTTIYTSQCHTKDKNNYAYIINRWPPECTCLVLPPFVRKLKVPYYRKFTLPIFF